MRGCHYNDGFKQPPKRCTSWHTMLNPKSSVSFDPYHAPVIKHALDIMHDFEVLALATFESNHCIKGTLNPYWLFSLPLLAQG